MPEKSASSPSNQTNEVKRGRGRGFPLPPATGAGLITAVLALLAIAVASSRASQARSQARGWVTHSFVVIEQLAGIRISLKDAETSKRGYLLTGEERYLTGFNAAVASLELELEQLRTLTIDNPDQQRRLDVLQPAVTARVTDFRRTLELAQGGDREAAIKLVLSDRGRTETERIDNVVKEMGSDEQQLREQREVDWREKAEFSDLVNYGGLAVLLGLILISAFLLSRDHRSRETEVWLKTGQNGALLQMQGEEPLEVTGEKLLRYLGIYLDALVAQLLVVEEDGRLRALAGLGVPVKAGEARFFAPGESLAGQAMASGRPLHVRQVPEGYLPVTSGLGSARPRELLLVPLVSDRMTMGVIELGFFRALTPADVELLARLAEPVAFALASARYKMRLRELLEESQRQAEELQSQQSEMEAQQAEMEATNAELSQTNAFMEVQTEELERQRDEVARAREAADRASQYKSEFLANMSHELRTPLNSSLILARLLADNREGNLTADQIRSAETIYGAGNDLLVLINDILDLSKIEAGRADVVAESVSLLALTEALERSFRPVANERKLRLLINKSASAPAQIITDGRRLQQILKNLLSNAFKFTSSGEVELTIAMQDSGEVCFAVRDTGIGIAPHQREVIFEAFRQADGTTSRKYGGTGLGLSISRELAHLLGGELTVESTVGRGSTFSLVIPVDLSTAAPDLGLASAEATLRAPAPPPARRRAAAAPTSTAAGYGSAPVRRTSRPASRPPAGRSAEPDFPDDRTNLTRNGRLILAIEDDSPFSKILYDLAHELDFDCVISPSGDEGIALARELQPCGILLDIGLPDASGLSVLERLKREPSTRHIPIHMVSVSDSEQAALELGAIGYAFKPVAREELIAAFEKLRERHDRSVRRVLIVEDDLRQQESLAKLLGGQGVELVMAGSVKESLEKLEKLSVDCMVLDLTLPDGSGYDLLEKMAEGARYSFPPVIVYTGRELKRADEERLMRYSRSIIVKGARSPERLLDEVTLFLHQVESTLPADQRRLLAEARQREAIFEGRRILVVEDDVRNVFALSKVLEPRGAKVEIARNGREALEVLDRVPGIDLVLMDIMMPEMDGLTAMREIRKRDVFKRLPIIALTAKAMSDDREQALGAGANDYMAKPFEVDKLVSLCRVWLRR